MRGLSVADSLASWFVLGLIIVFAISPLILAWYKDLASFKYSISKARLVERWEPRSFIYSCSLLAYTLAKKPLGPDSNATKLLASRFAGGLSLIGFILSGIIGVWVLARPLEMKYFFLELTFTGSRLRLVFTRLALAVLASLFSALLASFTASAILLVAGFGSSFTSVLQLVFYSIALSAVSGAVLASVFSLGLRSTSAGILAVIGFAVLVELLSERIEWLEAIVNGASIVLGGKSVEALAGVLALSLAFASWRALSLEY